MMISWFTAPTWHVKRAYCFKLLELMGYAHICRFAGGMKEWEEAGYLLVCEMLS